MSALNPWPWPTPDPGIYFGMPNETYQAIPCLQSTKLKNLLICVEDFWWDSWMCALREPDEEKKEKHLLDGTAYHTRILEGRDRFLQCYAPDFEDDPKDTTIIRTSKELREALKQAGKAVTFANKQEGIERLLSARPHARIKDRMEQQHREQFAGRELIAAKDWRYIEFAAGKIERHPELQTYFVGGYPEMTIIWDDPDFGVRFKVRIDYQKVGPPCDLKTFANKGNKPIGKAIRAEMSRWLYPASAWLYLRGVNYAKEMLRAGQFPVHGDVDKAWLEAFAGTPAEEFWYIFVKKGKAPAARGAKFSLRDTSFADIGKEYIVPAVEQFKTYYEYFGEAPWVDLMPAEYVYSHEIWGW